MVECGEGLGFVGGGVEAGGGNVVPGEEVLGEDLAALELCGCLDRTEDGAAGGAEVVDDAIDEGRLGADDGEVYVVIGGKLEVVGAFEERGGLCNAWISGGGEDAADRGALGQAPGEGMFAAAGADDEYVQAKISCR